MIPVDQTLFEETNGNCMAASIASVLEIPLAGIPNLGDASDPMPWEQRLRLWAHSRGLEPRITARAPRGYTIALGIAHRGTPHAVVVYNGLLAHEVSPQARGRGKPGLKSVDGYLSFVRLP